MKITVESKSFEFGHVEWMTKTIRDVALKARPLTVTGIKSVTVTCKQCGHVWKAEDPQASLENSSPAGALVKCPECGSYEEINMSQMF